jgi:hypothetical protein
LSIFRHFRSYGKREAVAHARGKTLVQNQGVSLPVSKPQKALREFIRACDFLLADAKPLSGDEAAIVERYTEEVKKKVKGEKQKSDSKSSP